MDFESWAEEELADIQSDLGLTRPRPNQSLFKYVSLDTEKSWNYFEQTFDELKLFGQSPQALNDPFELQPAIFNDIAPEKVRSLLGVSRLSEKFPKDGKLSSYLDRDSKFYTERSISYLTKFRENSRVISLCERYDSPLLWAHYANSYSGACIHFLGGKMQQRGGSIIGRVVYADQRPMYPLSLALVLSIGNLVSGRPSRAHRAETNKLLYFTKASDWAYEKEYRVVYNTNQVTNFSFNPDSLVSIILGPKMDQKIKDRVIDKVRTSALTGIPIYQAQVSTSNFSVQVDWSQPVNGRPPNQ